MASHPLPEVSRCHEFDCAVEPSRRRTDTSLLTSSKRRVSIVLAAMRGIFLTLRELLQKLLGRFDFVSFNTHSKGSLNGINGNNQRLVPIARQQDAFHTIEGAAPNPHPLTNLQKGMRGPR